ncbi:MAG: hypothetical protein WC829_09930 [Hyphomicrobium sp.]|jgi:hypothetical protein
MSIKRWQDRVVIGGVKDISNRHIQTAMKEEIGELRAALAERDAEIAALRNLYGGTPIESFRIIRTQRKVLEQALEALNRINDSVPAIQDGGGFVVDHRDADGEYIGSENIDPMWVIQEMQSTAHLAITAIQEQLK